MDNKIIIFLPSYLSINIVKKKNNNNNAATSAATYISIFNYFFFFKKIFHLFFFNFYLFYILIISLKSSLNFYSNLFYSWENFFFKKFLILGKGFKLKKFFNFTSWKFNTSHFYNLWLFKSLLRKINKKKFIIISKKNNDKYLNAFVNNIYTRNIFLKKKIKLLKNIIFLKKKKH